MRWNVRGLKSKLKPIFRTVCYVLFLHVGSDSGGSIRNPCHMCGIAGLKPTSGRLPLHGQASDGGLPG